MTTARVPAHLEVGGLVRAVEGAGGFAAVLQKGERDAGVILIVTTLTGARSRLWERMPQLDGSRRFSVSRAQDQESMADFSDYLSRRMRSDPDCWVIELDIANPERFIDSSGT